jgi:hypothetical protein
MFSAAVRKTVLDGAVVFCTQTVLSKLLTIQYRYYKHYIIFISLSFQPDSAIAIIFGIIYPLVSQRSQSFC